MFGKPELQGLQGRPSLTGIAFDANGNMWVSGQTPNEVYQRLSGVWQTGIAGPTGQTSLTGIAFDADGNMWVSGQAPAQVYQRLSGVWQTGIAGPTGQASLRDLRFETEPLAVPSFTDDTGDAITGTVGQAITSVTVPVANGNPAPTYAAVGSLPAGVSFATGTRILSFDETAIEPGTGTIRIRATNSEGMDDWTVAYTFRAGMFYGASGVSSLRYGSAAVDALYYGTNRIF